MFVVSPTFRFLQPISPRSASLGALAQGPRGLTFGGPSLSEGGTVNPMEPDRFTQGGGVPVEANGQNQSDYGIAVNPAEKSHPIHQRSILDYLGTDDLQSIVINQRNTGNCYLISAMDTILQSPHAKEILRRVLVEEPEVLAGNPKQYVITFPSGEWAKLDEDEIGKKMHGLHPVNGPKGIQMLELAYAKVIQPQRQAARKDYESWLTRHLLSRHDDPLHMVQGGNPRRALQVLLGDYGVPVKREFHNPLNTMGPALLGIYLKKISLSPNIYLLSTWQGRHSSSVRRFDLDNQTITIGNPSHFNRTKTYSFPAFLEQFEGFEGFCINRAKLNQLNQAVAN